MSRSYPIWNEVENCSYESSKSYGNRETGKVNIYVGGSAKDSHFFLEHIVTKRGGTYNGQAVIIFKFSVDGVVVKEMIFEDKLGKAGKHIKTISKLEKLKEKSYAELV